MKALQGKWSKSGESPRYLEGGRTHCFGAVASPLAFDKKLTNAAVSKWNIWARASFPSRTW
jgi:hypothetical protein